MSHPAPSRAPAQTPSRALAPSAKDSLSARVGPLIRRRRCRRLRTKNLVIPYESVLRPWPSQSPGRRPLASRKPNGRGCHPVPPVGVPAQRQKKDSPRQRPILADGHGSISRNENVFRDASTPRRSLDYSASARPGRPPAGLATIPIRRHPPTQPEPGPTRERGKVSSPALASGCPQRRTARTRETPRKIRPKPSPSRGSLPLGSSRSASRSLTFDRSQDPPFDFACSQFEVSLSPVSRNIRDHRWPVKSNC